MNCLCMPPSFVDIGMCKLGLFTIIYSKYLPVHLPTLMPYQNLYKGNFFWDPELENEIKLFPAKLGQPIRGLAFWWETAWIHVLTWISQKLTIEGKNWKHESDFYLNQYYLVLLSQGSQPLYIQYLKVFDLSYQSYVYNCIL